jgi:hypothetical protein
MHLQLFSMPIIKVLQPPLFYLQPERRFERVNFRSLLQIIIIIIIIIKQFG